ncbi:MAG: penicillin acylase family protein, partial [Deltaproteobacteria bacterium]
MRTRMLAAASVLLAACAGSEPQPKLSISPTGSQTITGPVLITASPIELANEVTWSLSGSGTLSNTTGHDVTYRPPVPAVATPATVTATARGQTATVTFTGQTPQQAKVVIAPKPAQGGQPAQPGLAADVNVTYDQFDIPHIFCQTDTDCFMVQGYLQAQDRLFQMDLFRRTAEGRLAELVGAVEAGQDQQFLTLFITRDLQRIEDKLYAALTPDIKAKVDAYAAGVNAYLDFLAAHPTLMPQEYAQLPGPPTPADIPHWRGQDTLAIGRLQQFQLSETIEKETGYGMFARAFAPGVGAHPDSQRFTTYVLPAQPVNGFTLSTTDPDPAPAPAGPTPAPAAAALGPATGLGAINAQMRELNGLFGSIREGSGSNNWVVDGAHSATGFAMVANDPHLPLQFPPLFHLVGMTSADGKLDVTGGSFAGVPGALVGRGAHVGWGVTVVGYDVTDLYLETVNPACTVTGPPTPCVHFNGADVHMLPKVYTVKVKGGADKTVTVLVVPHHGPVIQFDPVNSPTQAISMRWTGHEVTADLAGFLGLIEATAVGTDADVAPATTAFAALRNYAIGAQNFVLADDAGHIGYDPHALVPKRDWANEATLLAGGPFPWLPLPGDGTAEWGSDPACSLNPPDLAACFVADNQLPRGVDAPKGYFATANSDPAGYTGHATSPFASTVNAGLYKYLAFDWSDPTDIRYARIAELLKAKTAAGKVSLADMQAVQSDHSMLLARIFETRNFYPATADVLPASNQAPYTAARQLLQAWATTATPYDCPTGLTTSDPKSPPVTDAPTLTNSAACLLFHTFLNKLIHNVFDDDFAVVAASNNAPSFSGDTGAEIRALVLRLLPDLNATGTFCDDVTPTFTATPKKCGQQVSDALVSAFGTLAAANGTDTKKWLWGRVHTLTSVSPASPLIANGFSAGPFARPGGALTVDVGNPSGSQSSPLAFAYGSGSNVRHISVMDPNSATAQVKMQLPGPERDAPFGVFSSTPDLLGQYVQNQYFDFLHGHQIDNKGVSA